MSLTIGVDIGGTKIAGGLVDDDGVILARARRSTPARSSAGIVEAITAVVVELTEAAAMTSLAAATHFIHELRQRGCRFSLDDFGSGLSSFFFLKSLPVDFLKIDGQFMHNVTRDEIDRSMVEAIAQIGASMNIRTVAERVDSAEVLSRLAEIGIQYAQGHYIGAPQPVEVLASLVAIDQAELRRLA